MVPSWVNVLTLVLPGGHGRPGSFHNSDCPSHAFVPGSAEIVAMKSEGPCFVGDKSEHARFAGRDIGADLQVGAIEAMHPVERRELQHNGHALLDDDIFPRCFFRLLIASTAFLRVPAKSGFTAAVPKPQCVSDS
jgi:hypothetical protein